MALLTVTETSHDGVSAPFVAADLAGDEIPNLGRLGRTLLEVKNDSAGAITVTIDSQAPCSYGFDHDINVSVPAGESRLIGPFDPRRFNDTGNKVQVSYSAVASVTVRAVRLPEQ